MKVGFIGLENCSYGLAFVELGQLRFHLLASLDNAFVLLLDLLSQLAALLFYLLVRLGLEILLAFQLFACLEFYSLYFLDLGLMDQFEFLLVLPDLLLTLFSQLLPFDAFLLLLLQLLLPLFGSLLLNKLLGLFPSFPILRLFLPYLFFLFCFFLLPFVLNFLQFGLDQLCIF